MHMLTRKQERIYFAYKRRLSSTLHSVLHHSLVDSMNSSQAPRNDPDTFIKDTYRDHISLSEPEDDDPSDVQSFYEDDMYDDSENGDDVIYYGPDSVSPSPVDSMVRPLLRYIYPHA